MGQYLKVLEMSYNFACIFPLTRYKLKTFSHSDKDCYFLTNSGEIIEIHIIKPNEGEKS